MIRAIILNEVKHTLLSLRFIIGLLFVLGVFTGGSIIFCKKYLNEMEKDSHNRQTYQSRLEDGRGGLVNLYADGFPLSKYQELSSFFSTGSESRFPKALVVAPDAPQGALTTGSMLVGAAGKNYKLESYTDFDLTFIIGIVLSFLAVVLSFDAISRDREEGTLKQQLSNPVARVHVLLGKYAAILILLLIAMFIGSLLSVIIIQILVGQNILALFPVEALMSCVLSIVFLSLFIWLSLWVSAGVSRSATSLALLLLLWMILVVLSPFVGSMIAQRFYRVTSQADENARFQALLQDLSRETPKEWDEFYHGKKGEEGWGAVEKYSERQDAAFEQITTGRFTELTGQAARAESFNFFSPYGAFKQVMERFASTGLAYHEKFFTAARQYREELVRFIREEDKRDPASRHHIISVPQIRSMSSKPVDPAIIPRFTAPTRRISAEGIGQAMPGIVYLFALNVVFFFLALFTFLRMDVRS